jgi:hypothetical protein
MIAALVAVAVIAGIGIGVLVTLHLTKPQRDYFNFRASVHIRKRL